MTVSDGSAAAPDSCGSYGSLGPVTIYVLWHPRFLEGRTLARGIYRWLRTVDGAMSIRGSEIPVYYRSEPWIPDLNLPVSDGQRADAGSNALEFPGFRPYRFDAETVVVVALVDAHMTVDKDWRAHLRALAGKQASSGANGQGLLFVPVQIDQGFSSLNAEIGGINAIQLGHWREAGDGVPSNIADLRRRRLCRNLTQLLVRHLRERLERAGGRSESDREEGRESRDGSVRLKDLNTRAVFLSHAKSDAENGVGIAEVLQREALRLGQIETFMDVNSLDWARPWQSSMMDAAGWKSAALVAIVGDRYASRYWCRNELRIARRPKPVSTGGDESGLCLWWVQPVVAIDSLSVEWTRVLPELSGIPILRWHGEETAEDALDRLMLEALQSLVHLQYSQGLRARLVEQMQEKARARLGDLHFLPCSPEPYVLTEWHASWVEAKHEPPVAVIYPGHGMMIEEERRLQRWFGDQVRFLSLDELADVQAANSKQQLGMLEKIIEPPARNAWRPPRPLVGVVVESPGQQELNALGQGDEHLEEGVFRLVRTALNARCRLVDTGFIFYNDPLLSAVLESAGATERVEDFSYDQNRFDARTPPPELEPPLEAWLLDHGDDVVGVDAESRLYGRCGISRFKHEGQWSEALETVRVAEAQTVRARELADACGLLLVIGGRPDGLGWLPAVLEQAAEASLQNKPVLPLAAFGGSARRLVAWLLDPGAGADELVQMLVPAQPLLTVSRYADRLNQRYQERRQRAGEGLVKLKRAMGLADSSGPTRYCGLEFEELIELMCADSVRKMRRMLQWKVLPSLLAD